MNELIDGYFEYKFISYGIGLEYTSFNSIELNNLPGCHLTKPTAKGEYSGEEVMGKFSDASEKRIMNLLQLIFQG